MCGICGFDFEDKNLLKKMCELIRHRGPDNEGFYVDSKVSIGMRRLSIIDLNTGNQPQHNEENNIWIVFNGEIYNFMELKRTLDKKGHKFYTQSDTEVIIHAYEEWGMDSVKKLRGQFAFCIYDSNKQILFLARDHVGLKPLYYYSDNNRFIFGSEIKSILSHDIKRKVNNRALNFYLSLQYAPFNLTLFEGIFKLPPASYMVYNLKNKEININKYWELNFIIDNNKNIQQLANELKKLIEESVKIRLISDVPLGAFLSGGLDSTAVVAMMTKFMKDPVNTFSIIFEEGAPINESNYSRYVANYYDTNHTELLVKSSCYEFLPNIIWSLDDLIADAAVIPVFLMAKYAKIRMTVALTGDGADEVFAGYTEAYKSQRFKYLQSLPNSLLKTLMRYYRFIPSHKVQLLLSYIYSSKTELDRYLRFILKIPDEEKYRMLPFRTDNIKTLIKTKYLRNLDIINQFIAWDLEHQLPNQYNMKIDKMSMAASLEARVPFLDYRIIEWSATIPSRLKFNGITEKYILRLAMQQMLPNEILKRKKTGFGTPVNFWLRKGLKEISEAILEKLEKRKSLFKSDYIKLVKKNRFNRFYENRAWNLIMFELWYETFLEQDDLKVIKL
jgi:asparagine synthase (glutamine-hydrolysing)